MFPSHRFNVMRCKTRRYEAEPRYRDSPLTWQASPACSEQTNANPNSATRLRRLAARQASDGNLLGLKPGFFVYDGLCFFPTRE